MDFAVVSATERDREFIADPSAKRPRLRKAQVMGIGGNPPADQAWLLGNRFDMLPVPNAPRRRQCQYGLVDNGRLSPLFSSRRLMMIRVVPAMRLIYRLARKACQLGFERLLDALGIGWSQAVFGAEHPMSPIGRLLGRTNVREFGRKLIPQSSRWFSIKNLGGT